MNNYNMNNLSILKKKFNRDGYIVIKKFFSESEINEFEKTLISVYSKNLKIRIDIKNIHKTIFEEEKKKNYDLLYACYNKYKKTLPFRKASRKLILFSNKIFDKKFKLLNSGMAIGIRNSRRTAYDWHQEHSYYKKFVDTVHFQFPIFDSTSKNNGTMSVLQKSHELGVIKKLKNIKYSKKSINTFLPKNINEIKKKFNEKFIIMKKGDLCLFHENIIHKTNKNKIKKIRFVPIIRLKSELNLS